MLNSNVVDEEMEAIRNEITELGNEIEKSENELERISNELEDLMGLEIAVATHMVLRIVVFKAVPSVVAVLTAYWVLRAKGARA